MELFSVTAILVISSAVLFFPNGSLAKALSHNSSFCPSSQTECAYGCCPYAQGTCCSNGYQCCRPGETCIPSSGLCIGITAPENATASSRAAPITLPAIADKNSIPCPPCTTTCGEEKCCRFRDGTCCEDGQHCCPYRYACDISQQRCYRTVYNELPSIVGGNNGTAVTELFEAVSQSPYETCPGTDLLCPSYSICCANNEGQWMCCLKPFQVGTDQADIC